MPTLSNFAFELHPDGSTRPSPSGMLINGPLLRIRIEIPEALATMLREAN